VRHGRHLRFGRPVPAGLAASRGPQRCDIVAVRTATMSHRGGWRRCHRRSRIAAGGVSGACAAGGVRAEPPPAALRSPASNSLRRSTPTRHPCREALVRVVAQWA
jgi:hypothetical protein